MDPMSVRDPRSWPGDRRDGERRDRNPLADLSERLAEARRAGEPAPEELERLVSLLAQSDYEPGERLTRALEGLVRWTGSAWTPEPAPRPVREAPRRQPVPAELEARLVEFANSLGDRKRTPPQPSPRRPERRADPLTPPIASLRAALAEISERQKALDEESVAPRRPAAPRPAAPERAPAPERRPEVEPYRTYAPQAQKPAVDAASTAMARELRTEIDRLGRSVADLPTRREVDGLAREMNELASRLSSDRPARLDRESLGAIDALVAEVDRMRGDAASPQMIAGLAEELHVISSRLDALGPSNSGAIEALARRIDEVRTELAQFPRASAVDVLASEIQALIDRLDEQERAAQPTRQAVAGLSHRVETLDGKVSAIAQASVAHDDAIARMGSSLRAELGGLPRAEAFSDLGRQIDALTESLKSRSAIGPALKAVEGLSGKVEVIDGKIEAIGGTIEAFARNRGGELQWLSEAMRDEIAATARPDAFEGLERQIEALSSKITGRRDEDVARDVRALSGRVEHLGDRMQAAAEAAGARSDALERVEESVRVIAEQMTGPRAEASARDGSVALESEVRRLVESFEDNDGRLDDLNAAFSGLAARIERSCADLGAHCVETAVAAARDAVAAPGQEPRSRIDDDIVRSLADLRASAASSERRSGEALDAVRSTLERLLDRMERIEASPRFEPVPEFGRQTSAFRAPVEETGAPETRVDAAEAARAAARRALAEIASGEETPPPYAEPARFRSFTEERADEPIEPGSGAPRTEPASGQTAATFIAAARRASHPVDAVAAPDAAEAIARTAPQSSRFSGAIARLKASKRPFMLGLAATLIVFAALYVASGMTGEPADSAPPPAPQSRLAPDLEPRSDLQRPTAALGERASADARAAAHDEAEALADAAPPPEPYGDAEPAKSAEAEPVAPAPKAVAEVAPPRAPAKDLTPFAFGDAASLPQGRSVEWKVGEPVTTGSIAKKGPDGLPDSIGGPTLRMRAVSGDPSAQLEIADRLLEGRNVEPDARTAAVWLEKAASQGLAPAQHRLGSLYEKGRGVARDLQAARRWYEQAAASGNVRAMHNLGVVHAEGGLGKPDYAAAAVWFRMAAERGLVDSQYNLAVLDVRGLGGKRDLVAAYKWFALAAAQGDEDAGRKRDEVAKTLGSQLPAAKAAVETFRPRPVDAAANEVPGPPGGWDRVADRKAASAR